MEKGAEERQNVRGGGEEAGVRDRDVEKGQRAGQSRTEHSGKWRTWAHPRWAVPVSAKAPCDTRVCAPLSTHSPSRWARCPQRPFLPPLLPSA